MRGYNDHIELKENSNILNVVGSQHTDGLYECEGVDKDNNHFIAVSKLILKGMFYSINKIEISVILTISILIMLKYIVCKIFFDRIISLSCQPS